MNKSIIVKRIRAKCEWWRQIVAAREFVSTARIDGLLRAGAAKTLYKSQNTLQMEATVAVIPKLAECCILFGLGYKLRESGVLTGADGQVCKASRIV